MRAVDEAVSRNRMNFERDVLQRHLEKLEVFGYRVPEYAVPITSLDGYFRANMALLQPEVRGALSFPTVPYTPRCGTARPPCTAARQCFQFAGGGRRQNRGGSEQLHYFPGCPH